MLIFGYPSTAFDSSHGNPILTSLSQPVQPPDNDWLRLSHTPNCYRIMAAPNVETVDRQTQEPRHISRRFTTLEGWHEVRTGVYSLGQRTLALSFAEQFDLERYNDDRTSFVALSKSQTNDSGRSKFRQDEEASRGNQSFHSARGSMTLERPYHIYSSRQKWSVVVLIGVAGLFSGLSSNIYFPSLDAIARVSGVLAYRD